MRNIAQMNFHFNFHCVTYYLQNKIELRLCERQFLSYAIYLSLFARTLTDKLQFRLGKLKYDVTRDKLSAPTAKRHRHLSNLHLEIETMQAYRESPKYRVNNSIKKSSNLSRKGSETKRKRNAL